MSSEAQKSTVLHMRDYIQRLDEACEDSHGIRKRRTTYTMLIYPRGVLLNEAIRPHRAIEELFFS